ncbi:Type IV pilus biogenesis protein PilF [Pseudoalteromonas luteoviolacea B = ATCC 29581]|nr:Type IV pilus biogenesis protein PilF [Pseudoalteromonas luteoviolacea B = ATCC 29581]
MMRKVLVLPLTLLGLSGCVTQTTYLGSEKPVVENKVDTIDAAKTRIALALQYLTSGNTTQAKFNLERAADMAPELPEVHYSFAHYYQTVGEDALAKKAYLKALDIAPNDPNTLNNYGAFLCRVGEYAQASEQFLKAIAIPSYLRVAQSYENLALCSIKANNFDAAEQHLRSAVNHNGQRQSAMLLLAQLLYAKSDLHQALQVLKVYENKGFISAQSAFLQYLVETRMGRIEQAELQRKTLLQTYPTSVQASWVRDNTLAQSDVEQLREQFRQAQIQALTNTTDDRIVQQPTIKVTRKVAEKSNVTAASEPQTITASGTSLRPQIASTRASESPVIAKTTNTSSNSSNTTGVVQFYEPDPTEVVFSRPTSLPEVTFSENTAANSPSSVQTRLLNPDLMPPSVPYHVLQIGENLFSISVKYNIKMSQLLEWNALKESERLAIGSKIYLNNPRISAQIQAGDSLLDVANRHAVMVDELMRWNKLTPDVALKEGYSLLVVDPTNYKL